MLTLEQTYRGGSHKFSPCPHMRGNLYKHGFFYVVFGFSLKTEFMGNSFSGEDFQKTLYCFTVLTFGCPTLSPMPLRLD